MDRITSRRLLEKYSLIPRKKSKKILDYIRNDKQYDKSFNKYVSKIKFQKLKDDYIKTLLYMKKNRISIIPKNLPFLHIIKEKNPKFFWTINNPSRISNNNTDLVLNVSNVEGLNPSLASIIFDLVDEKYNKNSNYPSFLDKNEKIKKLILNLFNKVNFVTDISKINETLYGAINRALLTKNINILTPLCPDYANIDLGQGLYKFTFDGLGSDIGLTARRLIENLDGIHTVFEENQIVVKHIAAIGDFEALSEDTCKRVNLSRRDFIKKLKISQNKLRQKSNNKVETILFTELCDGFDNWEKIHSKFYNMIRNNDFGNAKLSKNEIDSICKSRKPLLYRWFGKMSDKQLLDVVMWQGAEYATMGYIAENKIVNPLIIGADHFKMSTFYLVGSSIPILYLTSNYIRN